MESPGTLLVDLVVTHLDLVVGHGQGTEEKATLSFVWLPSTSPVPTPPERPLSGHNTRTGFNTKTTTGIPHIIQSGLQAGSQILDRRWGSGSGRR